MNLRLQRIDTGEFFVLSKDGTLTIDINSTIFNAQGDFLGSIMYPGKMPVEPNRKQIQNAHYINTAAGLKRQLDVMMWLGALPYKQTKMFFSVNNTDIEFNLYIDSAIIANQLRTLNLNQLLDNDIDDQVDNSSAAELRAYMMAAAAADPGQYPMVFYPFKNDGAYVEAMYAFTPVWLSTQIYQVGAKVLFTDNHIYEASDSTAAGQDPLNWGPRQVLTSNEIKWQDITVYEDIALPVSTIMNRWELDLDGNGGFVINGPGAPVDQTVIPAFYLVYILKRIAHFFGYTTEGLILTDPDAMRITVLSNIPIEGNIIPDYFLMMPALNVGTFLKMIRSELGWLIDFDQVRGVMVVESLANLINDSRIPVVDLQQQQTIDGFRETATQTNAWVITQKGDASDAAWAGTTDAQYPTVTIGDASNAIAINQVQMTSVATKMIVEQTPVNKAYIFPIIPIFTTWRIPWLKTPVNGYAPLDQVSSIDGSQANSFGLRMLYYQGPQPDSGGYKYPYASFDNKNTDGTPAVGFSLDITDNSAAFVPLIYYYTFLLNSKPFEMVFELLDQLIVKIKVASRVIVRDLNYAAVKCVLSQLSCDFTPFKTVTPAKLTLYPVIQTDNLEQIVRQVFVPPPPPYDNGVVYVKISQRNEEGGIFTEPPPGGTTFTNDIYAQFFADAGGTVPKAVIGLVVTMKVVESDVEDDVSTTETTYPAITCTSALNAGNQESLLQLAAPTTYEIPGTASSWVYSINPSANYNLI